MAPRCESVDGSKSARRTSQLPGQSASCSRSGLPIGRCTRSKSASRTPPTSPSDLQPTTTMQGPHQKHPSPKAQAALLSLTALFLPPAAVHAQQPDAQPEPQQSQDNRPDTETEAVLAALREAIRLIEKDKVPDAITVLQRLHEQVERNRQTPEPPVDADRAFMARIKKALEVGTMTQEEANSAIRDYRVKKLRAERRKKLERLKKRNLRERQGRQAQQTPTPQPQTAPPPAKSNELKPNERKSNERKPNERKPNTPQPDRQTNGDRPGSQQPPGESPDRM